MIKSITKNKKVTHFTKYPDYIRRIQCVTSIYHTQEEMIKFAESVPEFKDYNLIFFPENNISVKKSLNFLDKAKENTIVFTFSRYILRQVLVVLKVNKDLSVNMFDGKNYNFVVSNDFFEKDKEFDGILQKSKSYSDRHLDKIYKEIVNCLIENWEAHRADYFNQLYWFARGMDISYCYGEWNKKEEAWKSLKQ